eukprot:gene34565-44680_t
MEDDGKKLEEVTDRKKYVQTSMDPGVVKPNKKRRGPQRPKLPMETRSGKPGENSNGKSISSSYQKIWGTIQDTKGEQAHLSKDSDQQTAQEMETKGKVDIDMEDSKQGTESYDRYDSPDLATAMLQARIRQEAETTTITVYQVPNLLCKNATEKEELILDAISEDAEEVETIEVSMDTDGYSMDEEHRAALRHQDNNIIIKEIHRLIPIEGMNVNGYEILGHLVKRCTSGETVNDTNMKAAMDWLNFLTQTDMNEGRGVIDDRHVYSLDQEFSYDNPPEEDETYSYNERDVADYEDLYSRIDTTFGLNDDAWRGDHTIWSKFRCFMCSQRLMVPDIDKYDMEAETVFVFAKHMYRPRGSWHKPTASKSLQAEEKREVEEGKMQIREYTSPWDARQAPVTLDDNEMMNGLGGTSIADDTLSSITDAEAMVQRNINEDVQMSCALVVLEQTPEVLECCTEEEVERQQAIEEMMNGAMRQRKKEQRRGRGSKAGEEAEGGRGGLNNEANNHKEQQEAKLQQERDRKELKELNEKQTKQRNEEERESQRIERAATLAIQHAAQARQEEQMLEQTHKKKLLNDWLWMPNHSQVTARIWKDSTFRGGPNKPPTATTTDYGVAQKDCLYKQMAAMHVPFLQKERTAMRKYMGIIIQQAETEGDSTPKQEHIQELLLKINPRMVLDEDDYDTYANGSIPARDCLMVRVREEVAFMYTDRQDDRIIAAVNLEIAAKPNIPTRQKPTLTVLHGGTKTQMAVILSTNYTNTDSHGHSVIEIIATVYWLGLEGEDYDEIQRNFFTNVDGMKQLHALHWMGYKLEMLRDIQIIRIMAAELLHDLRCHTSILGTQGEIVALAYIVEATKRQQSKGCRMIIHWTHSPEMTNLEIKFRERLYWSIHNQEMHVEQYAVVGMTSVVQITNLRHQGAYTNAEDDEKGAEQSEDEVGADQAPDDEGRESEDGKEHTHAQDLADTMAATHILNANRNMGKSYRVATTEGAARSTIGPKDKSVRLEPLGLARQGGGTVLGKEGEGRSGYTRGEEGRGGRGRMISSPQQHAQMGTAEDRTNAQMDTDTRRRRAQLQEEVAELMQYYT